MKICLFNLVKRHTRARATAGDCCFLVNVLLDLAQTRGLLRIERDREALKILERSLPWVLRATRRSSAAATAVRGSSSCPSIAPACHASAVFAIVRGRSRLA
jgi:hypothetical protein